MQDFFTWIISILYCLLPPVPLLPLLPLLGNQIVLQKHLSDHITSLCKKARFPCLKDTSKCLCLRIRCMIHQEYAWFRGSVCWHETTACGWKANMVRNGQGEGWKEHRPLEASLCFWASPRPSHYGPPDSLLWEIITSPLLLLLLAELDPSWSVPKPTSQPSSPCILPSSYYKLRKHPPAFFFLYLCPPLTPALNALLLLLFQEPRSSPLLFETRFWWFSLQGAVTAFLQACFASLRPFLSTFNDNWQARYTFSSKHLEKSRLLHW